MSTILNYLSDMMIYMLAAFPFILGFRFLRANKAVKISFFHESAVVLFTLFLVALYSQAVFSHLEFSIENFSRINLIPFKVLLETYREVFLHENISYFVINFFGNVIIFMPIGIFVPLLYNNITFKKTAFVGFLISLSIEICQLPLDRATDIDDLWLNTLGAVFGYLVYKFTEKIFSKQLSNFKERQKKVVDGGDF